MTAGEAYQAGRSAAMDAHDQPSQAGVDRIYIERLRAVQRAQRDDFDPTDFEQGWSDKWDELD